MVLKPANMIIFSIKLVLTKHFHTVTWYHGLYGSTSCCLSHGPCQWERAIFDLAQLRDPWTDFHET